VASAGSGRIGAGQRFQRSGLSDDAMAAAKDMNETDRGAMIRGMVERLASRLKQNGDDGDEKADHRHRRLLRARNMGPASRYAAENAYQRATASAEPGSPLACTHN
jgi:hypothetical protein